MLPAKERLTRSGLFRRAYSERKCVSAGVATLYVVPRTYKGQPARLINENRSEESGKPTPRRLPLVGFVVGKKVNKKATLRNRAKRRLREAYRALRLSEEAKALRLEQWYALVFVAKDEAIGASWSDFKNGLRDCLKRADNKFGANSAKKSEKADKKTLENK